MNRYHISFTLQAGLSVMVNEYGLSTCNCLDSAMGYSKENQTCLCPYGLIYTEDTQWTLKIDLVPLLILCLHGVKKVMQRTTAENVKSSAPFT